MLTSNLSDSGGSGGVSFKVARWETICFVKSMGRGFLIVSVVTPGWICMPVGWRLKTLDRLCRKLCKERFYHSIFVLVLTLKSNYSPQRAAALSANFQRSSKLADTNFFVKVHN